MLALFAIGTTAAFAQNLVENPYFDADLSSWQIFPSGSGASVEWTPDMNHVDGFESRSGAVSITAPNVESFAQQCVGVEDNDLYIVTAWTYEQCVGAADLYVFWANNDCVYDGKYEAIHARSTKTGEWERVQVAGVVPSDRRKALVTLVNPGCAAAPTAYFDDVNFLFDWIFRDGFESSFDRGETF